MLTLARQPSGSGSGGNGNVIYDDVIIRQQKYELRLIFKPIIGLLTNCFKIQHLIQNTKSSTPMT